MRLKIRCDGESEKICKIFWEVNKALVHLPHPSWHSHPVRAAAVNRRHTPASWGGADKTASLQAIFRKVSR